MAQFEKNDTQDKIIAIVVDELKIDRSAINDAANFADLGADSLDMVQIMMKLEEQFGIEVNDEDAEKMATLADVVDYVQARRTK